VLDIDWEAGEVAGLGGVQSIVGVAHGAAGYALVAELGFVDGGPEAAAYWSSDGTTWELAQEFPPGERILTLTAGGPGFVAGGFAEDPARAAVWTSPDARSWQSVSDTSLNGGVIGQLLPTASGLVGFGWRSDRDAAGIWTSADGLEWLAATNETGLTVARGLEAVGAYAGRAIAVVREEDGVPAEVWETTGRAEWTRIGSLPTEARVERVAGGPAGWVAVGSSLAWTSPDGREWSDGVSGPDVAADLIADEAGYVAVGWIGSLPGETCGDQRPFAGHTWTSSDGRTWRMMPVSEEFREAMVTRLLVVDRTLVGYGQRLTYGGGNMPVARWAAMLPGGSVPADASDLATLLKGCGG